MQTSPDGNPLPDTKGSTFFTYDRIFDENSTTQEVYEGVARDIVHSVVRGLNGTIFAYGQTSSGKTFTMQGGDDHETPGIVQLAARDLFQQMEEAPDRMFLMRVSYLEIYQEDIKDLLNPEGSKLQVLCGIRLSYLQTFLRCRMDIGLKAICSWKRPTIIFKYIIFPNQNIRMYIVEAPIPHVFSHHSFCIL